MYDKLGDLLSDVLEKDNTLLENDSDFENQNELSQAFELLECSPEMNFEQIKAKYYMLINSKKNDIQTSPVAGAFRKEILTEFEKAFKILSDFYVSK